MTARYTRLWGLVLLVCSTSAFSWNGPGHMLTGLIAFDQMSPDARAFIADWLTQHRRFDADFAALMPDEVPASDRDRWIFAHAGTWPDLARGFNHLNDPAAERALVAQFHQGTWHYINLPLFLDDEEAAQLTPVPANLDLAWTPGERLDDLNGIQALKRAVHMQHGSMARPDKAVLMTWIFHLVSDLHQPTHTTALFTTDAFPRGDRGGNCLKVGSSNLHARWDNAVATGTSWRFLKSRTQELIEAYGAQGEAAESELGFEGWLEEGREVARTAVYSESIRSVVADVERASCDVSVTLDAAYVEEMRRVARQRITEARFRLGAWLEYFAEQE